MLCKLKGAGHCTSAKRMTSILNARHAFCQCAMICQCDIDITDHRDNYITDCRKKLYKRTYIVNYVKKNIERII